MEVLAQALGFSDLFHLASMFTGRVAVAGFGLQRLGRAPAPGVVVLLQARDEATAKTIVDRAVGALSAQPGPRTIRFDSREACGGRLYQTWTSRGPVMVAAAGAFVVVGNSPPDVEAVVCRRPREALASDWSALARELGLDQTLVAVADLPRLIAELVVPWFTLVDSSRGGPPQSQAPSGLLSFFRPGLLPLGKVALGLRWDGAGTIRLTLRLPMTDRPIDGAAAKAVLGYFILGAVQVRPLRAKPGQTPAKPTQTPASPEATIRAFVAAMGRGDVEAMKKLTTGAAQRGLPQTDDRGIAMFRGLGASFKSITDVKIDGHRATAVLNMDSAKLATLLLALAKARLAGIKDPKQRAAATKQLEQNLANLPQLARQLARVPVHLIKKDGRWLISELKGP